jgi:hypothetical membrane protein
MLFFPEGYSFLDIPFSALGLSVIRGYETPLMWLGFATATTAAGALSIPFWLSIRTVFTETKLLKWLSWIGTLLGVAAGPCLAGVGIFAGDLYPAQHGWSTLIFFFLFAIAIGVYSVAILLNSQYENVYSLVGFVVMALSLLYIFVLGGAAMQKVAVYSLVLYSVFQGYKLLNAPE